jgi:hypothetical protein
MTGKNHKSSQLAHAFQIRCFSEATEMGLVSPQRLAEISRDGADEHLIAIAHSGQVEASLSLWWKATPELSGRKTGYIGHFAAGSPGGAGSVLSAALNLLKSKGAGVAVGPIDGNTWNKYRFVSRSYLEEPAFFLEPANDPLYPEYFSNSGFEVLAKYYSAISNELRIEDERARRLQSRMKQLGVSIRSLDMTQLDRELSALYRLSIASFRNNFLYTVIPENEFVNKYRALREYMRPELVKIAEHGSEMVGFIFVLPDVYRSDTVIAKTIARNLASRYSGLGNVLLSEAQNCAAELGYRQVIHALFHESNHSAVLSRKYAKLMREYSLLLKYL